MLNRIANDASKASQNLREFRAFVAPVQLDRMLVDLRDVLRDLSMELANSWPFRVDHLQIPFPINVDVSKLKDAFTEIAKNAYQAMEGRTDAIANVTLSVVSTSGQKLAKVEISDRGPGVQDKYKEHIFEPFVTSKGKNGTGLGLSNARKVIEKHSGTIEVKDNPGGGACFVIHLPMCMN